MISNGSGVYALSAFHQLVRYYSRWGLGTSAGIFDVIQSSRGCLQPWRVLCQSAASSIHCHTDVQHPQLMRWLVHHFALHRIVTVNVPILQHQPAIVCRLKQCRWRKKKTHNVLSIRRFGLWVLVAHDMSVCAVCKMRSFEIAHTQFANCWSDPNPNPKPTSSRDPDPYPLILTIPKLCSAFCKLHRVTNCTQHSHNTDAIHTASHVHSQNTYILHTANSADIYTCHRLCNICIWNIVVKNQEVNCVKFSDFDRFCS